MSITIKINLFAILTSLFSIFIQTALLFQYRRLPREKKNTHFYYYLFTSSCFTLVMLLLEALFYISPQLLDCTCVSTAIFFILFENLSQWCLIGYGLSFYVNDRSFVLTVATVAMAIACATMKLCLTYNASPNLANCDLMCFTVMILVFVTIFVHKFNDDREGRIAGGKTTKLSVTITGSIALLITAVFAIVDYETGLKLFNYINLSIVYSVQNSLICMLISLYCPIACSSFAGLNRFHYGLKKSKVHAAPKQQRYCSMSLRSHRSRPNQETTTNTAASHEEIEHNVDETKEEHHEIEIAEKY